MQAYGNDYIYIFTEPYEIEDYSLLAQKISDRHFGVGADGLIIPNTNVVVVAQSLKETGYMRRAIVEKL